MSWNESIQINNLIYRIPLELTTLSTLNISGATLMYSDATVTSNLTVVSGNTSLGVDLSVKGDVRMFDDAYLYKLSGLSSQNLVLTTNDLGKVISGVGSSTVLSALYVSGNTTLQGDLNVSGNSTMQSNLNVSGNATMESTTLIKGAITGLSNLNISGSSVFESNLLVKQPATMNSNLTIAGNVSMLSKLSVFGVSNPIEFGDGNGKGILDAGANAIALKNTGGSVLQWWNQTGNVGIGTLNPDTLLHVSGSTTINQNLNVSGNSNLRGDVFINITGQNVLGSDNNGKIIAGTTGSSTALSVLLVSGNSTLLSNLSVSGNTLINNNLSCGSILNIYNISGASASLETFGTGASSFSRLYCDRGLRLHYLSEMQVFSGAIGSEVKRMSLTSGGYLGLGNGTAKNTPQNVIDARFDGNTNDANTSAIRFGDNNGTCILAAGSGSGGIYNSAFNSFIRVLQGSVNLESSGTITNVSDERIKEDVKTIEENALEKIKLLRPVEYHHKLDPPNKISHGFIAQEVETVIPCAVDIRRIQISEDIILEDGRALDMSCLNVYNIKAVQELSKMVENNKMINNLLLEKIHNLESRIQILENK
jgi:hypothetical protein